MDDLISRQAAINVLNKHGVLFEFYLPHEFYEVKKEIRELPSAESTLYGYNIEHLKLIARILQKENLSPERVEEALTDIGRIVAIVRDEFEETLRRSVRNIERRIDETD